MGQILLATYLLFTAIASYHAVAAPIGAELNPSIMILGSWDYELRAAPGKTMTSRCVDMVQKAAKLGGTRVQFVPTWYWRDNAGTNKVDEFCMMSNNAGCVTATAKVISDFQTGMAQCFQATVDRGLSIAIAPHLDDVSPWGSWRNSLLLDPLLPANGFSYYDVMLKPLVKALKATRFTPTTKVWFATSAEMSTTLMRYPTSYVQVISALRTELSTGVEGFRNPSLMKVGISYNFNKLWIVENPNGQPMEAGHVPPVDAVALKKLFDSADFIGVSAYAEVSVDVKADELESSFAVFAQELAEGVPELAAYLQTKELHFSEFGLGGGVTGEGKFPAQNPTICAQYPFFGIGGNYAFQTDPWQIPENSEFRRLYYTSVTEFLMNGGPHFKVSAAFLWNLGSWDVLAIYPESTNDQGSYKDDVIANLLIKHNAAVNGVLATTFTGWDKTYDLTPAGTVFKNSETAICSYLWTYNVIQKVVRDKDHVQLAEVTAA